MRRSWTFLLSERQHVTGGLRRGLTVEKSSLRSSSGMRTSQQRVQLIYVPLTLLQTYDIVSNLLNEKTSLQPVRYGLLLCDGKCGTKRNVLVLKLSNLVT